MGYYILFIFSPHCVLYSHQNCIRKRQKILFILRGIKRSTAQTCPGGKKGQEGFLPEIKHRAQSKAQIDGFGTLVAKTQLFIPKAEFPGYLPSTESSLVLGVLWMSCQTCAFKKQTFYPLNANPDTGGRRQLGPRPQEEEKKMFNQRGF